MDTIRKWLNKPKADDKSLLARFYHADRALTAVASELDSFDGRAEPERCSRLVGRLRQGQDRVLAITSQIMDELLCDDRAPRAFRAKFPEEVLQDSLAGQLWFGAECLAAGSSIMNRENESAAMRPLAKAVTKSLDTVRNLLRDQCYRNNIPNSLTLSLDVNDAATENLYESLKIFDKLFAEFELLYVSAMVQVKSKQEHETQELICVLFSETLQRALKINLLEQDQVDAFDPSLMFSIPRLAIIVGLVIYDKGPLNMDLSAESMSEMFRPFRSLLIKIRTLLRSLNKNELRQLEKLLCTNEDIHLKNKLNCDGDSKINSDDELVSEMISDCVANKDNISNFYSVNEEHLPNGNDWDEDREVKDNLVIPDCASGYLIPNTNFGHLFLASDAPLTDSFISNEDEYNSISLQTVTVENTAVIVKDGDSGIGTGNTSLDRTPESEPGQVATTINVIPESNDTKDVLTGRYTKNWENLEQTRQPAASCSSKIEPSESSDESESTVCDIIPGTSQAYNITTKIKISNETQKQLSRKAPRTANKKIKCKNNSLSSSSISSSSSGDTLSTQSDGDRQEVALALRAAGRMKYKTTENLLHRLFVCIAGVADQLQTNFASDLRQILKSVFLMNTTPPQEEMSVTEKTKDTDLFEFRASENDVVLENNGGSNQSIYSAEEVNPESDSVFLSDNRGERSSSLETEITVMSTVINSSERSRSVGETEQAITTSSSARQYSENKRTYSERGTRTSTIPHHNNKNQSISRSNESSPINRSSAVTNIVINSNSNNNNNFSNTSTVATHECTIEPQTIQTESPPRWIPDEEAPRCMACFSQFTAFRRRHHCRNCGGVFCGVCSSTNAPLPRYGLTKAVRVCRSCYLREVGT